MSGQRTMKVSEEVTAQPLTHCCLSLQEVKGIHQLVLVLPWLGVGNWLAAARAPYDQLEVGGIHE